MKGSGSTKEKEGEKKSLEGKGSTGKERNEGTQGAGTNRQTKRRARGGLGNKTLTGAPNEGSHKRQEENKGRRYKGRRLKNQDSSLASYFLHSCHVTFFSVFGVFAPALSPPGMSSFSLKGGVGFGKQARELP